MKRFLGILWSVLACCLLPEFICLAEPEVTIQEQVLADEAGIRITATGLKVDSMTSSLYLEIENGSNEKVTIYANRTSVNGFMIDGTIAKEVEAHETVNASIGFLGFLLEDAGISQIGDIETGFYIVGETLEFNTEPVMVQTSLYGTFTQEYDDSGDIFFDEAGIRMVRKDLSVSDYVTGQNFYIDNASEKNIQIKATENTVNGTNMESTLTFPVIGDGKKAIESVSFMKSELEKAGISKIDSIASHFAVYDADTMELLVEKEISFGQTEQGVLSSLNLKDELAYSDEYVQVKVENLHVDNLGDSTLDLMIKNIGNETASYSFGKVRVNGKEVSGSTGPSGNPDFLVEIGSGEEYETVLRIGRNDLAQQGITEITAIDVGINLIIGYDKIHNVTANIPFDEEASAYACVTSDITKKADDYIVNTYFIQGTEKLSVLYELKNVNDTTVSLHGKISFKDADGNVIDTKEDELDYISPDCYNFMLFETTEAAEKVSLTLTPSVFTGKTASLSYEVDETEENALKINVTNNGDSVSGNTMMTVVFVKDGEVYGYSRGIAGKRAVDIEPNGTVENVISDMHYDKYYIYLSGIYR